MDSTAPMGKEGGKEGREEGREGKRGREKHDGEE